MATCRDDCIHYKACKSIFEAQGYVVDGAGENADVRCECFETVADRVVRCKDCKYRSGLNGRAPFMFYICTCAEGLSGAVRDSNFCSYGERRDDNELC